MKIETPGWVRIIMLHVIIHILISSCIASRQSHTHTFCCPAALTGVLNYCLHMSVFVSTRVQLGERNHCVILTWKVQGKEFYIPVSQFSCSVISDSLRPHGLQRARPPCPSPTPGVYSNSCPPSQWCHPTISSSVFPFSSCPQSFPASGSFPMSQFFASGGQWGID